MDETRRIEVRRLWEVERLTMRQIAEKMGMGRRTVTRIIRGEKMVKPRPAPLIAPYERLIAEWYKTTPALMANQVLNRLRGYGYTGGYGTVKLATMELRRKRAGAFFELTFLPGEEAQVDWMEWKVGSGGGLRVRLRPGLVALRRRPVLSPAHPRVFPGRPYPGLP